MTDTCRSDCFVHVFCGVETFSNNVGWLIPCRTIVSVELLSGTRTKSAITIYSKWEHNGRGFAKLALTCMLKAMPHDNIWKTAAKCGDPKFLGLLFYSPVFGKVQRSQFSRIILGSNYIKDSCCLLRLRAWGFAIQKLEGFRVYMHYWYVGRAQQ